MSMNEVLRDGASGERAASASSCTSRCSSGKLLGTIAGIAPFAPPLTADAVEFILQPAVADMTALDAKVPTKHTPLRRAQDY